MRRVWVLLLAVCLVLAAAPVLADDDDRDDDQDGKKAKDGDRKKEKGDRDDDREKDDDRKKGKVKAGKRLGKSQPLEYEIVYTQSRGILTIGPSGCTYFFPAWNWYWSPPCSYGPSYYRDYMVYFVNDWMKYEVHVKNTGKKTYKNLEVSATQEYHEDICYWTGTCVKKGDDMPGSPTQTWTVAELKPGQKVVLTGSYYAPSNTLPGLDQTHLVVKKVVKGEADDDDDDRPRDRVLIDDPEAGVYCPPEPVTAPQGA